VRVLVLPAEDTTWLEEHDVTVFRGDILDPYTLRAPMRGAEGLFHLAAMLGAWGAFEAYSAVNVLGTANVCRAALSAGVSRVVHISSAMVYDMASSRPAAEDDLLAPLDEPYSLTKAHGDMLVQRLIREDRLPAVIIRPGTLIGPGDRLNFGRMADRIHAGKGVIIGRGNNAIPLFSITDLVQGLLLALDSDQAVGKIYNVGTDQPLTQARYLSLIARELGAPPPRLHVPYTALFTAARLAERLAAVSHDRIRPFLTRHGVKLYGANNLMSVDKARRELGYVPQVSVAEAVRMACDWYQHPDGGMATATPRGALTAVAN
jgi:nucleoside-diphosphate-sugar epimerase